MILLLAARAFACDCDTFELDADFADRDAVFAAEITTATRRDDGYLDTTVDVLEVWKGSLGATARVVTWGDEAGCGVYLEPGDRWLLFVDAADEGWHASLCSRSAELGTPQADGDVCALGPGEVAAGEGVWAGLCEGDTDTSDTDVVDTDGLGTDLPDTDEESGGEGAGGGAGVCGCASGSLSGGLVLPAVLALLRRRRPST